MWNLQQFGRIMSLFKSENDKNTAIKTEAFTSVLDLGTCSDVIPTYPIGNTIGTNGNANGTIGPPNGTIGTNGKPMVPLATNDTIGKISNGTIGRTMNARNVPSYYFCCRTTFFSIP